MRWTHSLLVATAFAAVATRDAAAAEDRCTAILVGAKVRSLFKPHLG